MPTQEWPRWPRRGTHWDVFNDDEIQSLDEGNEPPYWPDGPCFQYDQDATAFVLECAFEPLGGEDPTDTPADIIRECRQAVREIVKSWGRAR